MTPHRLEWTKHAAQLEGLEFARFQLALTEHNSRRLEPALPEAGWEAELERECALARAEVVYVEAVRAAVAPLAGEVPEDVEAFIEWFENLERIGPGQGDPLFPWLAATATMDQMKWFLTQEVAGEAGFDDLLAITQVKMPERAKLEMARNYWDEMGRGWSKGMHGPMLDRLSAYLRVAPTASTTVPEALALGNALIAMARHRRYAFHSVGALGVIEMTAPGRAGLVNEGLLRLGVPKKRSHYFAVHSVLDVKHSQAWNAEVLRPLVSEDPRRARAIAEGALIRLWHGGRCFERYRGEFGLSVPQTAAA